MALRCRERARSTTSRPDDLVRRSIVWVVPDQLKISWWRSVSLLGCASTRGWLSLQLFAAEGASREQPARRYDNTLARIRVLPAAKAPRSFRPAAVDLDEQVFDQSARSPAAVGVGGGEASAEECPAAHGVPRWHRNSEAARRRCIPHTARRVSRSNKSGTLQLSPSATALQSTLTHGQCAVCGGRG
jgi:hypothetical protein